MAASGAFAEAYSTVEEVQDFVEQRIKDATDTATQLQSTAMSTVSALGAVDLNFNAGTPPTPPNIDPTISVDLNLPLIAPTSFGGITLNTPVVPTLDPVPPIPPLSIPDFQSSISSLNIPTSPTWDAPPSAPVAPVLGDVTLPAEPTITMPALPALVDITVPSFAGLNMPTFSATAPDFQGSALPGILQWAEPVYHTVIIDEVCAKLRDMWAGGSGIPAAVEAAMWARAAEREDLAVRREIDGIDAEFSLRGFTMPTGMQAERTDQMRQDLVVKKLGLNRELTIQIAQWQVENMRFACTTAIAAENVYVNLFLNMAQRLFEAARFQVESQINIYNAQVSLFNARMNGYQISATVFNSLVEAELAKVQVFKAEIDAEVAKGQLNVQKVQVYTAQVQALQTQIEIYKAQMQGAEVKASVIRNAIEGFKASVEAYAAQVQAQKTKFDAYESQVKGEAAKAGIIDSEAKAYAAMVQGKSSIAEIGVKTAEVTIDKNKLLLQGYTATLEAERNNVQAQLSVIQTNAQAYVADTQRYSAVAQAESTKAQAIISAKEAELRTNVAFYQAQTQAYLGNMEQLIRKAQLIVDALKAAGGISSTLAAGAMAGVHVGATLSGTGGVSASGQDSYTTSTADNKQYTEVHNYEGT